MDNNTVAYVTPTPIICYIQ